METVRHVGIYLHRVSCVLRFWPDSSPQLFSIVAQVSILERKPQTPKTSPRWSLPHLITTCEKQKATSYYLEKNYTCYVKGIRSFYAQFLELKRQLKSFIYERNRFGSNCTLILLHHAPRTKSSKASIYFCTVLWSPNLNCHCLWFDDFFDIEFLFLSPISCSMSCDAKRDRKNFVFRLKTLTVAVFCHVFRNIVGSFFFFEQGDQPH